MLAAMLAGCGGPKKAPPRAPGADPGEPGPARERPATGSAGINGTVVFKGKPRRARPLGIDSDPVCVKAHAGSLLDEVFIYQEHDDGSITVGNVFVWITSGLPAVDYPAPGVAVVLDQKGCRFTPHTVGAMVGQAVEIRNSDPTMHNVHALSKANRPFNAGMPAGAPPLVRTFDRQEILFKIKCDAHPWMGTYVGIVEHPFFAVTKKDGKFLLPNLPAGTYQVAVAHELLKTEPQTVTIADGESRSIEFTLTPPRSR